MNFHAQVTLKPLLNRQVVTPANLTGSKLYLAPPFLAPPPLSGTGIIPAPSASEGHPRCEALIGKV